MKLPPLRECGSDVVLLARNFLARAAREHGVALKALAPDAVVALQAYRGPDNIRELANLMERVTLLGEKPTITAAALELPGRCAPDSTATTEPDARAEEGTAAPQRRRASTAPRRRGRLVTPPVSLPEGAWRRRRVTVLRIEPTAPALDSPMLVARGHSVIRDKVEAFGGVVDERDDTGVLACFGLAPSEDAPVRAAHAAMAVVAALRRALNAVSPVVSTLDVLEGRVGERGPARILHPDDAEAVLERLRVLLTHAQPGDVLVTAAALPYLERTFDDAPLAEVAGAARLVKAREAFARTGRRTPSAFVGRDRELAWLTRQVERLEPGQGHAIGVIGEPGAGKSRLLHEVRQSIAPLGVSWLEGRCVDHGTTTPYLPVADLLRRSLDAEKPADLDAAPRDRLWRTGLEPDQDAPYLERLLGLREGDRLARVNPETVRTRMFHVLRRVIQPGPGPVVIAIEDLQWIDRTSRSVPRCARGRHADRAAAPRRDVPTGVSSAVGRALHFQPARRPAPRCPASRAIIAGISRHGGSTSRTPSGSCGGARATRSSWRSWPGVLTRSIPAPVRHAPSATRWRPGSIV